MASADPAAAVIETSDRPDRRALLIETAQALFTERAYDEVTTTEIAKRAGVAYGLIAHHFSNKRGLYVATVNAVAEQLRAVHEAQPTGDTPAEMLREGILRHIAYVEENAKGYLSLMYGGSGSDPEVRAIIENFRWGIVTRLLAMFGVHEPIRPVLRTAMRGWSGYVTESLLDYLQNSDTTRDDIATLVIRALVGALRTAYSLDPAIGIEPALVDRLLS